MRLSMSPMHCSLDPQTFFLAKFSLKMGPTILFTHLKIILLQCFQFLVNKRYPNTSLKECEIYLRLKRVFLCLLKKKKKQRENVSLNIFLECVVLHLTLTSIGIAMPRMSWGVEIKIWCKSLYNILCSYHV